MKCPCHNDFCEAAACAGNPDDWFESGCWEDSALIQMIFAQLGGDELRMWMDYANKHNTKGHHSRFGYRPELSSYTEDD